MNLVSGFSLSLVFLGLTGLLLLVPLPGVSAETSVMLNGSNYSVELLDQRFTDREDGAWGSYNVVSNEIEVATRGHGVWVFMNTCSHEVSHLEFDLRDEMRPVSESLTTSEEHRLMGETLYPWNWRGECVEMVPTRLKFVF